MPRKAKYEDLKFVAPTGARDFYRRAAFLEGMKLSKWMRETLYREACRVHAKHEIVEAPPPVHPARPAPLLPGSR